MKSAALTFDDVLLVPQLNEVVSRRYVSTAIRDKGGFLSLDIPLISANMDTITGSAMASFMASKGGIGALHRYMSVEENIEEFKRCGDYKVIVSVGCSLSERERFLALLDAGAQYFLVDVAHAHASYVKEMIQYIKKRASSNICVIAGNIATRLGAMYLAEAGADIIKVGVGPGSVCTTRIKTGFGVPQLRAIENALDGAGGRSLIADGGIRTSGDMVKALAFGADFVMIGGMLAGTRPTPGEVEYGKNGEGHFKTYRGMASKDAHESYLGELPEWRCAEGVSAKVPYRTDEDEIIADLVSGLRSGLTYGGAKDIRDLQRNLRYEVITNAGRIESSPHMVMK